jgi:purine-binding chemotaxis protein CheW
MDILSIRKKGKKPAPTTTPAPASTTTAATTTAAPAPTTTAATTVEPALPSFPALLVPPPLPAPSNETIIDDALPPLPGSRVQPGVDDPLRGFLAMYDDVAEDDADKPLVVAEVNDAARRFLSFRLFDEDYAASIMDIREILTIRSLTEVPRAPKEVLGVVSKRGLVLPVIDLATSLGLRQPDKRLRASQRVLVVGDGDRVCGLRVDSVSEVIKLQTGQIEEVPASLGQKNAGLLLGLGRTAGALYILLDVAAVLDGFAIAMGVAPTPRAEG